MTAWRKILIMFVALTALVAATASGSETSSGGDTKSSGTSAAGSSASSDDGSKSTGDTSEVDDVKVNSCGKDDVTGWAQANITVTNNSSKASDYLIELTFTSKDGKTQIGTGNTIISNLAPGQNKTEDVSALEDAGTAEVVCTVSKVDRTAAL